MLENLISRVKKESIRVAEFAIGRRKLVPVSSFDIGISKRGGTRLREDLGLEEEPTGQIEVICWRKDHQDYEEIDVERLKAKQISSRK